MSKDNIALLKSQSFWESLLPEFTITEDVFETTIDPFSYDETRLHKAKDNLNSEGYYKLDRLIPSDIAQKLSEGIKELSSHGILPPFAFVYDAYWLAFKRLHHVLTQTLGNDWTVLPDVWAWKVELGQNHTGWKAHRDLNDYYVDKMATLVLSHYG